MLLCLRIENGLLRGAPRNRYLIPVDDEIDTKRILTYNSKGRAEAGFKSSFFFFFCKSNGKWVNDGPKKKDLEAVKIKLVMEEIN